jgi:hypothetical protein
MRRIRYALLFLTVSTMVLLGNALPALARHRGRRHRRDRDDGEAVSDSVWPNDPQCGWYENWDHYEAWWEYWCWWPNWGWEFVFWTW